ncbi:retrovirus-related pol polyprotein from transposon TNT 1-94 [Tanacetum coccineum]
MNIKEDWIKDTGASNHMTPNFNLFISVTHLKNPIIVHLPDGNSKIVTIVGKVQLAPSLILTNVFYVPDQPKVVRSDNGTEIVNKTCASFFQAHGVLHQKSIAHTPQQNGRVERKHRHLLDTARAIRLYGNLPLKFWGECILIATYLINKMPVKLLDWKSPFEKLYGKPPTYDYLRVIGCLCYAADIRPHKDKFDNRGIKSVLIGYPVNQKGYKLYNWETKCTNPSFTTRMRIANSAS